MSGWNACVPVLCAPDGVSVVGNVVVGATVGDDVVGASVGVAATHIPAAARALSTATWWLDEWKERV